MRTTVNIEGNLLAEAKRLAGHQHKSVGTLIEDALRELLYRRCETPKIGRIELPTMNGKGLQPGIDLDDSSALIDRMEEGHEAS